MKCKKIISLILMVLLCIGLVACGNDKQSDTSKQEQNQGGEQASKEKEPEKSGKDDKDKDLENGGKLFEKPFKISMLYADSASWPYREDWYVKKIIEEETGAVLDIIPVDATALNDKIHTSMASGDLTDIIAHRWMPLVKQYAVQGAYVEVDENMDKVPNFQKWAAADINKEDVEKFRVVDGKLYSFPLLGYGITNTRIWFYRKDILEKHGLVYPKSPDELYDVLVKLKEWEDPDSYPFNYRERGVLVSAWGVYEGFFYDESANEWCYGRIDDRFKEHVTFLRKLYAEKLIPSDIYSMDAKAWTDMMVQGKTFITNDYVGRVEGLIEAGKKLNSEYELAYMPPLNNTSMFTPTETASYTISKEGRDEEKIDNLLKYIDWLYSDEAEELLSWGQEGLTYKVEDGKRRLVENYRVEFGISNVGFAGAFDREALISSYPEMCAAALKEQPEYEQRENPASYLPLTDEEQEIVSMVSSEIDTYAAEQISLFVTGQKAMEEWDDFVNNVKSMDVEKVLEVYDTAYKRFLDSSK